MPTFYLKHDNPAGWNLDDFTQGYLGTAEWLAMAWRGDDSSDSSLTDAERERLRGFTRKAIAEAKRDCKAFQRENRADLATYCLDTGWNMESAGGDLWLSRNGHGAGYFVHGYDPVFRRLQDAASRYGSRECVLYRNRLIFEGG